MFNTIHALYGAAAGLGLGAVIFSIMLLRDNFKLRGILEIAEERVEHYSGICCEAEDLLGRYIPKEFCVDFQEPATGCGINIFETLQKIRYDSDEEKRLRLIYYDMKHAQKRFKTKKYL